MRLGTYKYLVDCVTKVNLANFKAASNPEDSIRLACEVVGARFRSEVK